MTAFDGFEFDLGEPQPPVEFDAGLFARIKAAYDALPPRPAEIKLTQEQLDRIPIAEPTPPWMGAPVGAYAGIPIRIVDNYWESTPGEKQLEELARAIGEDMAGRDYFDYTFEKYGPYRWGGPHS